MPGEHVSNDATLGDGVSAIVAIAVEVVVSQSPVQSFMVYYYQCLSALFSFSDRQSCKQIA